MFTSVFQSGSPGIVTFKGDSEGGGGASLDNIPKTLVDLTDPSWTLLDPDNLIDSVTHNAGFNTITWNALSGGSANYNWAAGDTHRAPRWYKLLKIGSTQVTSAHHLLFNSRIECDSSATDFIQSAVLGAAFDPTSTVASTVDGSGGAFSRSTTASRRYGTWQINGATVGAGSGVSYGTTTVLRSRRAISGGVYANFDSSDVPASIGTRNANELAAVGSTVNVFVMVGVGTSTNSATITAGDQQILKFEFSAVALDMS